jgi:hypothetical protein
MFFGNARKFFLFVFLRFLPLIFLVNRRGKTRKSIVSPEPSSEVEDDEDTNTDGEDSGDNGRDSNGSNAEENSEHEEDSLKVDITG